MKEMVVSEKVGLERVKGMRVLGLAQGLIEGSLEEVECSLAIVDGEIGRQILGIGFVTLKA